MSAPANATCRAAAAQPALLGWAAFQPPNSLLAGLQCACLLSWPHLSAFTSFHIASSTPRTCSLPACCRGNAFGSGAFGSGAWGGADMPNPLMRRSGSQPIPMLRQGSAEAGLAVSLPVDSMLRPVRKVGGRRLPAAWPACYVVALLPRSRLPCCTLLPAASANHTPHQHCTALHCTASPLSPLPRCPCPHPLPAPPPCPQAYPSSGSMHLSYRSEASMAADTPRSGDSSHLLDHKVRGGMARSLSSHRMPSQPSYASLPHNPSHASLVTSGRSSTDMYG